MSTEPSYNSLNSDLKEDVISPSSPSPQQPTSSFTTLSPLPNNGSAETIAISDSYDSAFESSDDNDGDTASIADSGFSSIDGVTMASSIYDYQYENGRRFHAYRSGVYAQPDDAPEQDRLNLYHHVWLLMLRGNLFKAPLNPETCASALDLGTGTGSWAIDFGAQFPNTRILGVDLSPIQPLYVSSNLTFLVDDIEDYPWSWLGWDWETYGRQFDYIHARNLGGSIEDWEEFLQECYARTTPGGYIELHESCPNPYSEDTSISRAPHIARYISLLLKSASLSGRSLDIIPLLAPTLAKVGFTDVTSTRHRVPWSPWPRDPYYKELGRWNREVNSTGFMSYSVARFKRYLGMGEEELDQLCDAARNELKDRSLHILSDGWVVWARKPLDST